MSGTRSRLRSTSRRKSSLSRTSSTVNLISSFPIIDYCRLSAFFSLSRSLFPPFFSILFLSISVCSLFFFFSCYFVFSFSSESVELGSACVFITGFSNVRTSCCPCCNCTSKVNSSHSCYCVPRPPLNYAHVV